ncbi:MAG TPA: SIR2 family protein [Terrimicrobiaceae bacterium]
MPSFPADTLDRLAKLILKGDVVFFVGSGFSIDSEGNSATRLIRRLIWRLLAFRRAGVRDADAFVEDMIRTFRINTAGRPDETNAREIYDLKLLTVEREAMEKLAKDYYEVNEWFCEAFGMLLRHATPRDCGRIHAGEEALRRETSRTLAQQGKAGDNASFHREDFRRLLALARRDLAGRRAAGKALFLDTLGFRHPHVMGGDPATETDLETAEASYHALLFPRHHVLARFAREGWCPTLITTNFDLLLEGAYRLAGFSGAFGGERPFPTSVTNEYEIVSDDVEFFSRAKAFRTAVIVKIHGCARQYRNSAGDAKEREAYLRALVFTYREIQNWREDPWAADFLRTQLRTRTVVFCGYSLRDPVIHDTFRTVYEEMARARRDHGGNRMEKNEAQNAPAYFFASDGDQSFHGLAVLNAASEANGCDNVGLTDHPNYLRFHFRNAGGFPDIDELFRWLYHRTLRERQRECVSDSLPRIAALLVRSRQGPCPLCEIEKVREKFKVLCALEARLAKRSFGGQAAASARRREFSRVCAWSERFQVALLREFACAEEVRRREGPTMRITAMRRFDWYFPTMENPAWPCWGAVVELALRRLAKLLRAELTVADCTRPTVFLLPRDKARPPVALTIELGGFDRMAALPRLLGHAARRTIWQLTAADAPWPADDVEIPKTPDEVPAVLRIAAPPAGLLWQLAMGGAPPADPFALAARQLGIHFPSP